MELETNVKEFERQMIAFENLTVERAKQLVQGTTFEAHNAIVTWTPVKTGQARLNWHFEIAGEFLGRIWNALPYIRRLEHGWSKQPGRGAMVQRAILFSDRLIRRAANKLGIK